MIKEIIHGEVMVLEIHGEFSLKEMERFSKIFSEVETQNIKNVILDFSAAKHLDYKVMDALLAEKEKLNAMGGDMILCSVDDYIKDIINTTGRLDDFLTFGDRNEGLKFFENQ